MPPAGKAMAREESVDIPPRHHVRVPARVVCGKMCPQGRSRPLSKQARARGQGDSGEVGVRAAIAAAKKMVK